jgi:beta-lactamase regulating signal transducer with metallopeptidase domain
MRGLNLLLDAALRAVLLGTAGLIAAWGVRRWGAEAEHAIWRVVLAAMLSLPLLTFVLPPLRILPHAVTVFAAPVRPALETELAAGASASSPFSLVSATVASRPAFQLNGAIVGLVIYLVVAVLMLAQIALSVWRAKQLASSAAGIPKSLLSDMVYPSPDLRESAQADVPFTAGWRDSVIVLPRDWREWSDFKLRSVLAHELAHIRRMDWIASIAGAVNRAVFWFHPLAWWLERRLVASAEEACDATVVRSIGDPAEYAKVVLDFAAAASMRQMPGVRLMAHTSRVGRRVKIILAGTGIKPLLTGFGRKLMLVVALPLVFVCASLHAPVQETVLTKSPSSIYSGLSVSEAGRAILSDGWNLTPVEAKRIEAELELDSEDLSKRIRLVSYYTQHMVNAEQRAAHLFWLIEHHPDSDVFRIRSEVTSALSDYTGLNSPANADRAEALWLRQADRFATNPMVLSNAATALAGADGQRAFELIKRVRALEPGNAEWLDWLAQVYATAVRSSFSDGRIRIMTRSASAVPLHIGFSLPPVETVAARRELDSSTDTALLSKVAEELLQEIERIRKLGFANAETEASEAYARQLLTKAQELDPNAQR